MDSPQSITDEEIDKLTEGVEYDGPSMPVEAVEASPVVEAAPVAPAAPPPEAMHEFTHNGRQVKAPLSQILKWSSQGYDYSQKISELGKQRDQITQLEGTYKPIDEWVRANPDKWERLQAVIDGEKNGIGEVPAPILEKLTKFESVINELQNERKTAREKAEDEALVQEVQSIREKHKDLDWATVDENGRTREDLVYAHANQHGFKTFKSAFLDLYHDDILKGAETRARESFAKEKERNTKTGLLGTKQAPGVKLSAPQTKTKNYESTENIMKELGL